MSNFFNDKVFFRNLIFLAIPIALQEMLNASINIADTLMIGSLGEESVAAVGLANQIFFLFSLIIFGINSGASIFIGQYWGKKDIKNIHKIMGASMIACLAVAILVFAVVQIDPVILMRIYSKDMEVISLGSDYLKIVSFSYILSAVIVVFNSTLRATGKPKYPMITTFVSLFSNVVLNYFFIFVFNWGVSGAAIATLLAKTMELIALIAIMLTKKFEVITSPKNYFGIKKENLLSFVKISTPVVLNEFFWALGMSIYNVAYKYSGTQAQAAVQISEVVLRLFISLGIGIGAGCGIMIANSIGAGNKDRAIDYSRKCMIFSSIANLFIALMIFSSAPFVAEMFNVTDVVKEYVFKILVVSAFGFIFKEYTFVTIVGILRSGGDTKFCLYLDALSVWLIGVPMAFLGSKFLGLPIYITVLLIFTEEVFKCIISTIRVLSNKWVKSVID